MTKIRSITKYNKIRWSDLPPHQQSSHEAELHWSVEATCSTTVKESCLLEFITQFPGNKKITLCITIKDKNPAGMNLIPPPTSQNSHAVLLLCIVTARILLRVVLWHDHTLTAVDTLTAFARQSYQSTVAIYIAGWMSFMPFIQLPCSRGKGVSLHSRILTPITYFHAV